MLWINDSSSSPPGAGALVDDRVVCPLRDSRPTGYKWLARYRVGGAAALDDQSRAPHRCPHRTSPPVAAALIAARGEYGWGARKLLQVARRQHPTWSWPARSTVNDLLARVGLLHRRPLRTPWAHPGIAPLATSRPNQVWPVDFKGQFKTGDGRYCFPLTVTDHCSRMLGVPGPDVGARGRDPARARSRVSGGRAAGGHSDR